MTFILYFILYDFYLLWDASSKNQSSSSRPGEIDEKTAVPGKKYTKAGFYIFSSAICGDSKSSCLTNQHKISFRMVYNTCSFEKKFLCSGKVRQLDSESPHIAEENI